MASESLEEMVTQTGDQIRTLKAAVRTKKKLLAETRAKDAAEIARLKRTVEGLRQELAEKRAYIAERTRQYEESKTQEVPDTPGRTPRVIATAICTFPNSTTVAVEYGDTPGESIPIIKEAREAGLPS
jgi:predicted RNase H-like nuclease (RuvC/YqgF family)